VLEVTTTRAHAVQLDVVVTPFVVLVRRVEIDVYDEPRPLNEDDEVLDPAVTVVRDPFAALLEASAEHVGGTGAAVAVDDATMDSAATVAAKSIRRAPFRDGSTREDSFRLFTTSCSGLRTMPSARLWLKRQTTAKAALCGVSRREPDARARTEDPSLQALKNRGAWHCGKRRAAVISPLMCASRALHSRRLAVC
jgi:hypothetical protein